MQHGDGLMQVKDMKTALDERQTKLDASGDQVNTLKQKLDASEKEVNKLKRRRDEEVTERFEAEVRLPPASKPP